MKLRDTKLTEEKQNILKIHFDELNELFGHDTKLIIVGSKCTSYLGYATASTITIRNTTKMGEMIETLAHEMMHVRQYATVENFDLKYKENKLKYENEADQFSNQYMDAQGDHYNKFLLKF